MDMRITKKSYKRLSGPYFQRLFRLRPAGRPLGSPGAPAPHLGVCFESGLQSDDNQTPLRTQSSEREPRRRCTYIRGRGHRSPVQVETTQPASCHMSPLAPVGSRVDVWRDFDVPRPSKELLESVN